MYILRPDIAEDDVNNHIENYNKQLEKLGGKVLDSQMRGKRRLAYTISKHREGIYVQLSHQGDGQHIFKLEKAMRLSDDVIRYMTIKQYGALPTPKPSKNSNPSEIKEPESSEEATNGKSETKERLKNETQEASKPEKEEITLDKKEDKEN